MKRRQFLFVALSLFAGTIFAVILLEVAFHLLPVSDTVQTRAVNDETPYMSFAPNRDLTWSYGPTFSIVTEKRTNNYGFFNDVNYDASDRSPLLAVIGDSYVEALQVRNSDALHGQLQRAAAGGRVYSFGASGSPLSNYLAYGRLATETFNADALVFVIVANDFDESLTKYKNAPGMHYFAHTSENWELVRRDYEPSAVKALLRPSALARYLFVNLQINQRFAQWRRERRQPTDQETYVGNTSARFSPERLADSKKVVDKFFTELPLHTKLPADRILFVMDGMRPHIYDGENLELAQGSYFDLMRQYFSEVAEKLGYDVIDMQPVFIAEHTASGSRFEFPDNGHWNATGHALAARQVSKSAQFRTLFDQ